MSLFTISLILFFTMDPVGNVSTFLKVLDKYESRQRHLIILREMLFVLVTMLVFSFFGEFFFAFLQLTETTVRLSSGVILFLIALTIIFPGMSNMRTRLPQVEPYIIPLAIPLIAGPATLATVMLFAHLQPSQSIMLGAIMIAWLASLAILLFGAQLKKLMGENGLMACEKLMGMILILLAIQRFMDGITSYLYVYSQTA